MDDQLAASGLAARNDGPADRLVLGQPRSARRSGAQHVPSPEPHEDARADRSANNYFAIISTSVFPIAAEAPNGFAGEGGKGDGIKALAQEIGAPVSEIKNDFALMDVGPYPVQLGSVEAGFDGVTRYVLRKEQDLINAISDSHADGYSTTAHDLLRDLIP